MTRIVTGLLAVVIVAFLAGPFVAQAQTKLEPYHPLTNGEMSEEGTWNQWTTTFSAMTPKQRAEVVKRHIKMCLDSFPLTDEQRTFVQDYTAKFVTEAAYDFADPEKRTALLQEIPQQQERAMSLLGHDLTVKFFFAKPPVSVLDAVKNDPAFK